MDPRHASYAARILPFPALPATCDPRNGDIAFITAASQRGLYSPAALNTWEKIGGFATRSQILNVRDFGAQGDIATDDTAAFAAAIAACPAYGSVFIPQGSYRLTAPLIATLPVHIFGSGFGSLLEVDPAFPVGSDIITLAPTAADGHYFFLHDFAIAPLGGLPGGRHGINLDGAANYIGDAIFFNLQIYGLNGRAIVGTGGGAEGMPLLTTIKNCILVNGVQFLTCGDTVRIFDNHFTGANPAVDVAAVAGASTVVIKGNSITNDGGIHISGPNTALQFIENEVETFATFAGSNGAILDIDGDAAGNAVDTMIARNSFQVVNGITCDTIRVNRAARTIIFGNRIARGLGISQEINITANAVDTIIGENTWPNGAPVIANLGTGTISMNARALQIIGCGASGVDAEQIRFNRNTDGNRYNSIYSASNTAGAAFVSMRVHDGVGATSQKPVMAWFGTGLVRFLAMPPVYANNAAAVAGGLVAGDIYRNNADPDNLCIVH